ncbi:ParM/StbA family protein [Caloramator sp. ALD01]|uniref:ParM/StbA family protein n=1 Tax=Caloramator sp. ALD01 TaxID=1031288 RepID=UPI000401A590|nr:ParM/StbA family protein [Caloramator sp. ALD01]
MKLAAIDNGYWATKVFTKDKQFSFRSKIEKANDNLSLNNTMRFFFNDIDYLVGEGATMSNIEYDKTSNELHKICTYAALANLSNFNLNEFYLVVGYPLNIYINGAESFAEYIKTNNFIATELNGETKLFKIVDVTVFPQCAGAAYVYPEKFKNNVVGIIDIGGLTVNGCIFDNYNLIRESMFTENLGSIVLFNKIKKALDVEFGMNIQEYEIPQIIQFGLRAYQEKSLQIINEITNNHVEEIKKVARMNKWNIENLEIMFIGGTSLILKEYLKRTFPFGEISLDPINDNVKGFYRVGEMVYGEENI